MPRYMLVLLCTRSSTIRSKQIAKAVDQANTKITQMFVRLIELLYL